jgi:hypothetical protein
MSAVRIVHNRLLGGWYVVTGPHQSPVSTRFDSRAEAQAWLQWRRYRGDHWREENLPSFEEWKETHDV